MWKYDAAKAGFSQTSLRRARSNLVSKAELYGGFPFNIAKYAGNEEVISLHAHP